VSIQNNGIDDFESATAEKRLREKLGDRCNDEIIRLILEAENNAVLRRESLVDMLDARVLDEIEYADKVNLVAAALLRDVESLVGAELCRRIYDVGPDERPVLVDPRQMSRLPRSPTSQVLAEIVVSELIVERPNLQRECDETEFFRDLSDTIVFMSLKSDVNQIPSVSISELLLYWQAVYLSCFVASRHSGGGVSRAVWRISDRILGTADWCLVPTQNAVERYYEVLPKGLSAGNTEMARLRLMLDAQDDVAIKHHEIVRWLRRHSSRVGQTEMRVRSVVNGE